MMAVPAAKSTIIETISEYAGQHPEKTALIYAASRLSYRELTRGVDRFAAELLSRGLKSGDRVGFFAHNSLDYMVGILGVWRAGGIALTLYHSFGKTELDYVATNAAPSFIFADQARADLARQYLPSATVLPLGDGALWRDTGGAATSLPTVNPDSPALICYTSGTSARPKPVTHSHRTLYDAAVLHGITWRLRDSDVVLVATPLAWLWGLNSTAMMALIFGASLVIQDRFRTEETLEILARHKVTVLIGVTTMFVLLCSQLRANPVPLQLRFCISGGEPRNEPVFEEWRALTGRPVFDSYGSSETMALVGYDPEVIQAPVRGSAGKILAGVELKLVDAEGKEVPTGTVGTALGKGVAHMLGYWNEPELTKSVFTDDGWVRMRDFLRIDDEGFVYVQGRDSDMIIRGGANISPLEIESVLNEHPLVEEAIVLGIPDETHGQQVVAVVLPVKGKSCSFEDLTTHCAASVAKFKVPQRIYLVDDYPRNANGKILRPELRAIIETLEHPGWRSFNIRPS